MGAIGITSYYYYNDGCGFSRYAHEDQSSRAIYHLPEYEFLEFPK